MRSQVNDLVNEDYHINYDSQAAHNKDTSMF